MSHEPPDPTRDLLRQLSPMPQAPENAARVRRRCHAVMARRAAHAVRANRPEARSRRLPETVFVLSIGLYLAAVVAEAVRVAARL